MVEMQELLIEKLLKNNLISQEQAQVVADKLKENGGTVVECILAEGFLEEKEMLSFLVNKCGLHFINLEKIEIDPEALAEVPLDLIKELKVVPIRRTKDMLAVVMIDPLDSKTHERLSEATVCRILPFIGQQKQLINVIEELDSPSPSAKKKSSKKSTGNCGGSMPLVKHFTFENFVSGKSNEFPYAMAMAVAKAPGKIYNPFFLYSNVGLGKTHLMNAIGNYLLNENPETKIMYATCEYFCSQVVEAIKENLIDEFRDSFRNVDLLMIDDIEFLGGREKAQEEFFHIFNSLAQNSKQVIVTNDRPPNELTVLEKRLQSRFMGGTVACIEPPDLETRMAILTKKSEGFAVPQEVQRLLAEKFCNNIRELEGALKTMLSFHQFTRDPINIDLAQRTLQEMGR